MSEQKAQPEKKQRTHPERRSYDEIFHGEVAAWVVLAVSLSLTVIAWMASRHYVGVHAQDNFNFAVEDARQKITRRMLEYEQVLRGGTAMFEGSDRVTRTDWQHYVSTLQLDHYYPGIQGMGYASMLQPDQVMTHEKEIRAEGFPEFVIHPAGDRERYSSIDYLEPFDWRNRRAFGYDMFSEPIRHEAMLLAMNTGKPAVSGRVVLLQETSRDVQAGFLMYLPVYRRDMPTATDADRRAAIMGFVYSPFRMKDLMQGILGATPGNLSFEIYDSDAMTEQQLMYRSKSLEPEKTKTPPQYIAHTTISLPGHTWYVHFHSTDTFEQDLSSTQPSLIGAGGVAVDILLFSILLSLSAQKKRIAEKNDRLIAIEAELQTALEKVEQMAYYDSLTELPNRRLMDERLQQSMAMSHRDHHYRALLFLDLDKFKSVNDELGHDAGDQVLIDAAHRMKASVREIDTVCRLGGDEFVVILEQLNKDREAAIRETGSVVGKIRQALEVPYLLEGEKRFCKPSIGITLFNDHESSFGQLLQLADEAMYAAKSARDGKPRLATMENVDVRIRPFD